jgi:hypothetical protein
MRQIVTFGVCVLMIVLTVRGAETFLGTNSEPVLRITKVTIPKERKQPLEITFEFTAEGKGPVALSQEQFSLHIFNSDQPYLFVSEMLFPKGSARVFVVHPDKPVTLSAKSAKNRFGDHGTWSDLSPGKYKLQIYANSGKLREFDYQWLGQTYSPEAALTIEPQ